MLAGALDEGDDTALVRVVGERVAPHTGGGAYATALVDALGARGMVRVAAHLPTGDGTLPAGFAGGAEGARGCRVSSADGTGAAGVGLACTWTSLLATATTSPLWTDDHRESLARDLASLVTVAGDVAEADTLLLPAGFRRLLTADQDPLTTAAAGTQGPGTATGEVPGAGDGQASGAEGQAPGAGGGRSGSRGALALDPKFLASLVRGLMAGETGAAAGGLRVGWVEYAHLATTAGGGYVNFPEGTPREVRARYLLYDPLAAVLTAAARRPQMVLDVLAPPVSGPDTRTLGPSRRDTVRRVLATRVDGSLWAWGAARAQRSGTACLEALTAAVASASTLRYRSAAPTLQPNPYEARAAWLTEQAVATLAGVDTTAWTPTARRATAVVLANSVGDLWDVATGGVYARGYQSFYRSLPVAWSGRHDVEVTALLREVLTDDTALAARAVTGGPSLTSRDLGDSVAYDLYHTLLLVMDRTRLLPDEAYLQPPDPFEGETDDQPPRPWNADWMYQDDQGHWHLDPDRADDDPDGFRTWATGHPVMAATTSGRYSIGARYDQGVSTQGRPPARHGPGIPPGQAALALLLTVATARLVYGYSHTYQRRAQQHWQHRRAR